MITEAVIMTSNIILIFPRIIIEKKLHFLIKNFYYQWVQNTQLNAPESEELEPLKNIFINNSILSKSINLFHTENRK